MRSLKPPAETTPDGVTYRPVPARRLGGVWLLMAAVSALAALGNGFGVPLTSALFAMATVLWLAAAAVDTRRGEVTVGLHRLVVRERILGLPLRKVELPWEEVSGARLDGDALTVLRADRRPIATAVRGTPGQVAWIVGHVLERVQSAVLTEEEARALEEGRQKVLALMGRQVAEVR